MSDIQPNLTPPHRPIQNYVFGAILILLFLMVCRLFAPFFSVLLWSVLLYIIIGPLHKRLIRGIDFSTIKGKILRNFWAVVFTLGTLAVVLIPISLLVSIFFRQIIELGRYARDLLNERPEYLRELFERISNLIHDVSAGQVTISADAIELQIKTFITNGLQNMVFLGSNVARNIGRFSINMLVMTFSMYFFYIDGPYLSRLVLRSIPIKSEYISTLTAKFMDITRNLFLGYIIVALLQSVVAYIIFTIFNIKGSLVLSVVTFLLVFFPVVGATLVYIPLAILKIAGGNIAGGIIFFLVSAVFISGIDNVLRPFFLKDRIQLHPLIIFFAILGGLIVFGFNGLILGPVLVILFLTVLDLFLTEHKIDHQKEYR
ncbi:MAG: AI-2E family transporter [Treponema sp.]|jgi:predicted PurR-regulated permease PerM|nr:AI-2E family transporter [Treponema sp.]